MIAKEFEPVEVIGDEHEVGPLGDVFATPHLEHEEHVKDREQEDPHQAIREGRLTLHRKEISGRKPLISHLRYAHALGGLIARLVSG